MTGASKYDRGSRDQSGGVPGGSGGVGIFIAGTSGGNVIRGNFLGTDPTGTIAEPNTADEAILRDDTGVDTIGGTDPASRNVIDVGNNAESQAEGLELDDLNGPQVLGNYIGTDITGTELPKGVSDDNGYGVLVTNDTGAQIGGTEPGASNVIDAITVGSYPDTITTVGATRDPELHADRRSPGSSCTP